MKTAQLADGVVHAMPKDFGTALLARSDLVEFWNGLTPLARNEWICWVEEAKKAETRERRITVGLSKMSSGTRRPCCWMGCPHRKRTGQP